MTLPIHLLRQFLFCRRVLYFQEKLKLPKANPLWVDQGSAYHLRQKKLMNRRTLQRFDLEDANKHFDIYLYNEEMRLHGSLDMLLETADAIYPVEFKSGSKLYFAHKVQMFAYGLLAEQKFGKVFKSGFLVYRDKGDTIRIERDEQLEKRYDGVLKAFFETMSLAELPDTSATLGQCEQCEYLIYCNDRQ